MFSDQQVEAAVRALSDPERFADAERLVSAAAPQLHRVLAHALNEGGWFGPAHQSEVRSAVAEPDEAARATRVETLLAEETRLGMMVGVAVGWELARELDLGASAGRGPARSHAVHPDEDPTDTGGD